MISKLGNLTLTDNEILMLTSKVTNIEIPIEVISKSNQYGLIKRLIEKKVIVNNEIVPQLKIFNKLLNEEQFELNFTFKIINLNTDTDVGETNS